MSSWCPYGGCVSVFDAVLGVLCYLRRRHRGRSAGHVPRHRIAYGGEDKRVHVGHHVLPASGEERRSVAVCCRSPQRVALSSGSLIFGRFPVPSPGTLFATTPTPRIQPRVAPLLKSSKTYLPSLAKATGKAVPCASRHVATRGDGSCKEWTATFPSWLMFFFIESHRCFCDSACGPETAVRLEHTHRRVIYSIPISNRGVVKRTCTREGIRCRIRLRGMFALGMGRKGVDRLIAICAAGTREDHGTSIPSWTATSPLKHTHTQTR